MLSCGGNIVNFIGALLSKHSTGCDGVTANAREHRAEGKACQHNSLGGQSWGEKRWIFTNEDQLR
jgi:hypothetical protein